MMKPMQRVLVLVWSARKARDEFEVVNDVVSRATGQLSGQGTMR